MKTVSMTGQPTDRSAILIGALAPLSSPGWVEAGRALIAGMELAVCQEKKKWWDRRRRIELVIRDTAGDPQRAAAAVDELAALPVAALAGEYHSIVARAVAAKAERIGVPFLCSSAVLDALTDQPTNWVARLAPAQSRSWRLYADFLHSCGHRRIAVAAQPSVYWESGIRVLTDCLVPRECIITELDMRTLSPPALCDILVANRVTALLILVGHPEPAVSIVKSVRSDTRLPNVAIGAPAGQPEFCEWTSLLGRDGTAIPFLRYLPERLTRIGDEVGRALRNRIGRAPSFVGFEGYDTVTVLADMLRSQRIDQGRVAPCWPKIEVRGTRGVIRFSRIPGISVWQWAWSPIQLVDRDPMDPDRFRQLRLFPGEFIEGGRTDSAMSDDPKAARYHHGDGH